MDNPQALPIGTRLAGEYRIESVLGSGGFGITYLAEEETLKRKVAVKEYFPTGLAAREGSMLVRSKADKGKGRYIWGLDRFIHEAQILAKFNHGNIVRVFRYFRENNTAYMVLHYEEGQSLKAWLDNLGRAPLQSELDVMLEQLLPALEQLHDADYLHRDIAPDNILIRADSAPVLIDFGSARGEVAQHSKTVSAIVKPGYSPFEQYAMDGRQQGPWTDIYSLGATLYYAISRRRPLDAPGRMTNDKHKSAFDAARGQYRKGFLIAIDQALEVKPKRRPTDIIEWRNMLFEPDNSPAGAGLNPENMRAPGADAADLLQKGRTEQHPPAATRLAGTMPAVPAFLRKKRVAKGHPKIQPVFEKEPVVEPSFTQIITVVQTEEIAAAERADSLGERLAKVRASGNVAAESNAAADKHEKPDVYIGFNGGAAALPNQVDIPLTRMVRVASGFSLGASGYLYQLVKLALSIPYRIGKAFFSTSKKPANNPAKAARSPDARKSASPAKQKKSNRPVVIFPEFISARPALTATLCALLFVGISVERKWIPDQVVPSGLISGAEATLVGFQREWPKFRGGIEQSYTSTLAGVEKLRLALGPNLQTAIGDVLVLRGHQGTVQTAIFTPDGKYVISGGIDERLRLWNASTGRLKEIISKKQGSITALDIRDQTLLTAEANGTVSLKNWRTGNLIRNVRHHTGLVHSVAFAKFGSEFFTAGQDGMVKLWRDQSNEPELPVESENGAIHAIATYPAKNRLATAGADRNIRIWDVSRNKLLRKFRGHKRAISSIDFSPDGKYLVSTGLDGRLKLWSSNSSRTRRTLHGHEGRIFMARFSPDGSMIASAGEDGTVRLWNVRRRRLLRIFKGHSGSVRSVAFSDDGAKVVSGSDDGTVRIWTVRPASQKIANRAR